MSRIVFFDELDTNDSLSENIKEQQLNLITRHNEFVYWNRDYKIDLHFYVDFKMPIKITVSKSRNQIITPGNF